MTHKFWADMIHYITCTVSERYDTLHVLYGTNPGRQNKTQRGDTEVNSSQVAQDTAHARQHHRAGTPVNRSEEDPDTAHATQHTERAHR